MPLDITRGTNIGGWLSQSKRRGRERREFFTRDDAESLAGLGFDHLRIPVDEEQLWDESDRPDEEAFGLLESALEWCAGLDLRAVVDLHILRSHHFNNPARPLWTDAACQERFCDCWRELSRRLGSRPLDAVAYELLNEAVADDPEDWNGVALKVMAAIRELEPERVIVLGSNYYNCVETFDALTIPEDDPKLILTFHFYLPFLVTHHQARWTPIGFHKGPVHYPGVSVEEKDAAGFTDEQRAAIAEHNGLFDRARLDAFLAQPLAARDRTGLPLYCGEFGCLNTVPRADRLNWFRDFMSVLRERDISWANWSHRGGFGFADGERNVDREIAEILLG